MTEVNNYAARIINYAKVNKLTEEEAAKKLQEEDTNEGQKDTKANCVDDREGSLSILDNEAMLAKIENGTLKEYELDGIKLYVDTSAGGSKFSYEIVDNKLIINAKKCVIDITEITNNDLEIEMRGMNVTLNSNAKVKSIKSSVVNAVINGSDEDDNIIATGMNTIINGKSGNDTIKSSGMYSTVRGGEGDDNITASGMYANVFGNDGKDNILATGMDIFVDAGDGEDATQAVGLNIAVNTSTGKNTIKGAGVGVTVTSGSGVNDISLEGKNNTVEDASTNDNVTVNNSVVQEADRNYTVEGQDGKMYNSKGYDSEGYTAEGFDSQGYNREGYNAEGFNRNGFDTDGYNKNGYNLKGYNREGFDKDGYDAQGFDKLNYDREGYDRDGFDVTGYNREGYNLYGYDRNGYNEQGYNKDGYNANGYNSDGYDKDGYNKQGYNREGYDKDGYDAQGFDKLGYDRDGYDQNGYDVTGYDKEGYNYKGINKDNYDRQGRFYVNGELANGEIDGETYVDGVRQVTQDFPTVDSSTYITDTLTKIGIALGEKQNIVDIVMDGENVAGFKVTDESGFNAPLNIYTLSYTDDKLSNVRYTQDFNATGTDPETGEEIMMGVNFGGAVLNYIDYKFDNDGNYTGNITSMTNGTMSIAPVTITAQDTEGNVIYELPQYSGTTYTDITLESVTLNFENGNTLVMTPNMSITQDDEGNFVVTTKNTDGTETIKKFQADGTEIVDDDSKYNEKQQASIDSLFSAWSEGEYYKEYATDFTFDENDNLISFVVDYGENSKTTYSVMYEEDERIGVMSNYQDYSTSVYQFHEDADFVSKLQNNYYDKLNDVVTIYPETYGVDDNYTAYNYYKMNGKLVDETTYNAKRTARYNNLTALQTLLSDNLIDVHEPNKIVNMDNVVYDEETDEVLSFTLANEPYTVTRDTETNNITKIASAYADGVGQTINFTTTDGTTWISSKELVTKITPKNHEALLEKVTTNYSSKDVESSRTIEYFVNGVWTTDYPYTIELPTIEFPVIPEEKGSYENGTLVLYDTKTNDDGTTSKIWDYAYEDSDNTRTITQNYDANGNLINTVVEDYETDGSNEYLYTTTFDTQKNYSKRESYASELLGDGYITITTATDPTGTGVDTEVEIEKIPLAKTSVDNSIQVDNEAKLSLTESFQNIPYNFNMGDYNLLDLNQNMYDSSSKTGSIVTLDWLNTVYCNADWANFLNFNCVDFNFIRDISEIQQISTALLPAFTDGTTKTTNNGLVEEVDYGLGHISSIKYNEDNLINEIVLGTLNLTRCGDSDVTIKYNRDSKNNVTSIEYCVKNYSEEITYTMSLDEQQNISQINATCNCFYRASNSDYDVHYEYSIDKDFNLLKLSGYCSDYGISDSYASINYNPETKVLTEFIDNWTVNYAISGKAIADIANTSDPYGEDTFNCRFISSYYEGDEGEVSIINNFDGTYCVYATKDGQYFYQPASDYNRTGETLVNTATGYLRSNISPNIYYYMKKNSDDSVYEYVINGQVVFDSYDGFKNDHTNKLSNNPQYIEWPNPYSYSDKVKDPKFVTVNLPDEQIPNIDEEAFTLEKSDNVEKPTENFARKSLESMTREEMLAEIDEYDKYLAPSTHLPIKNLYLSFDDEELRICLQTIRSQLAIFDSSDSTDGKSSAVESDSKVGTYTSTPQAASDTNSAEEDVLDAVYLANKAISQLSGTDFYNNNISALSSVLNSTNVSKSLLNAINSKVDFNKQSYSWGNCWLLSAINTFVDDGEGGLNSIVEKVGDGEMGGCNVTFKPCTIEVTDINGQKHTINVSSQDIFVSVEELNSAKYVINGTEFELSKGDQDVKAIEIAFLTLCEQNGFTPNHGQIDLVGMKLLYGENISTKCSFDAEKFLEMYNNMSKLGKIFTDWSEYDNWLDTLNLNNVGKNAVAATSFSKYSDSEYTKLLECKKIILSDCYDEDEVEAAINQIKTRYGSSKDGSKVAIPDKDGRLVRIYGNHVYTVAGVSNGYVKLINPHDNSVSFEISEVYFKLLFNDMTWAN